MPADVLKELEAVRQEARSAAGDTAAQLMALQRIAASLECIRVELVLLGNAVGRISSP